MKSHTRKLPVLPVILFVALASVPLLASWLNDPFMIRIFTRILLLGVAAMGLNLILGFGGFVSLMHAAFFGLGGYVVAIMAHHEMYAEPLFGFIPGSSSLALTIPAAVVVTALFAILSGIVSMRTAGAFFIMITLAFNQMVFYLFVALQEYGGEDGLQILMPVNLFGLDPANRTSFYYVCLALAGLTWFGLSRIVNSKFGMVLRGIAQNEGRIRAIGIEPMRYKLTAFVLSAVIVAVAGALSVASQGFVSPADLAWTRSGELVIMAVIGGITTVGGPLIGAAIFILLEFFISDLTIYWQLPFGLLIVFMAAFCPKGLANLPIPLRNFWMRPRHA